MEDKELEISSKLEIIMIAYDMVMTLEKATGLEHLIVPFVQKAILVLLQDKIEEGLANLSDARSLFRMVQEDPEYACDFYEYLMKERRLENCDKSYKKVEVITYTWLTIKRKKSTRRRSNVSSSLAMVQT
jgi:hypothetical protein